MIILAERKHKEVLFFLKVYSKDTIMLEQNKYEEIEIQVTYKFPKRYIPHPKLDEEKLQGQWPRKGWYNEPKINWDEILKDTFYRKAIFVPNERKGRKLVRMLKTAIDIAKEGYRND